MDALSTCLYAQTVKHTLINLTWNWPTSKRWLEMSFLEKGLYASLLCNMMLFVLRQLRLAWKGCCLNRPSFSTGYLPVYLVVLCSILLLCLYIVICLCWISGIIRRVPQYYSHWKPALLPQFNLCLVHRQLCQQSTIFQTEFCVCHTFVYISSKYMFVYIAWEITYD